MEKEKEKELKEEYKKFHEKDMYKGVLTAPLYFAVFLSIIIFWLPKDILSLYPWLKYFTEYVGSIFPNIFVYAQASDVPELTEFYFSYLWIVNLIMIISMIIIIPKANEEAKKYFGVGQYKGKGKFPLEYIRFKYNFTSLLGVLIFLVTISYFIVYSNFTGALIDEGIYRLNFSEAISNTFGMFFIGILFQVSFLWLVIVLPLIYIIHYIHILNLKKESKKCQQQ